jgi:hypothetical protein
MTETKQNYSFNLAKILPETVQHNNLKILEAQSLPGALQTGLAGKMMRPDENR